MPAVLAADAQKARNRNATTKVSLKLVMHKGRQFASSRFQIGQERRPMLLYRSVEQSRFGAMALVCDHARADEEGLVRHAQVIVNLENRRAVEVLRIGFFQYRALRNGRLDRGHFREIMAALPEAALGWLQLSKPPPGVVSAEHRFAKRRLDQLNTWKPTQDELSKLRSLVNHKAGREIM